MGDINSKNGLNVNGEDIQPLDIEDVAADFVPLSLNDDNKELLEEDLKEIMEDDIQEEASPDAVIEFDEIPNDGDVDDVDVGTLKHFLIGAIGLADAVSAGKVFCPVKAGAGYRRHLSPLHQLDRVAEMIGNITGTDDTETII